MSDWRSRSFAIRCAMEADTAILTGEALIVAEMAK